MRLGSFFQRVAASLGDIGANTAIEGFMYNISGQEGSLDVGFTAQSVFGACQGEQRMYWALFEPAGLNEAGKDLGYSLDPKYRPPPLVYNCDSKCVSGGHVPLASFQGLCPTATWGALDAPSGGAAGCGQPPLAISACASTKRTHALRWLCGRSRALRARTSWQVHSKGWMEGRSLH